MNIILHLFYIILLLFIAITSPICGSNYISVFVVIASFFYIHKSEYLLNLLLFCLVFFYRIPHHIPVTPIITVLYVMSVFTRTRLVDLHHIKFNIRLLILAITTIIFLYYSCYYSITESYSQLPLFVSFILLLYFSTYDRSLNLKTFQKLLYISAIIGLSYIFIKLIIAPHYVEGRRGIFAQQNVNATARGISMLLVILCYRLYTKYANRFVDMSLLSLGLFSILLTGSRTALLSFGVTIYLLVITYANNKKKILTSTMLTGIAGLILYTLISFVDIPFLERFTDMLSVDTIMQDTRIISSGLLIHRAIIPNPLWGVGLGNENSEFLLGYIADADNLYIDMITQVGFVGFFAFVILIIMVLKKTLHYIKYDKRNKAVLFVPLALMYQQLSFTLTESMFDELGLWFAIALMIIYINSVKYGVSSSNDIISCSKL